MRGCHVLFIKVLKGIGWSGLGIMGVVLLIALIVLPAIVFNSLLVALVWNWLGLHAVFGAAALGFWPVVGIGVVLIVIGI